MEKIAIVGLSCLFPDAQNPEVFWQNLMAEQDATDDASVAEFGLPPGMFYGPDKKNPDKTYSLKGGFIRDFHFDPTGYHLSAEVIRHLDPLAQSSLYVAKQALQHSGDWENKELRSRCGVILGNLSLPTKASQQLFSPMYQQVMEPAIQALTHQPDFQLRSPQSSPTDTSPANALSADALLADALNARVSSLPSTVVAQALGLSSISFSLDAACSSSLYAIKLAGDYLLSGEADMMLAGAASYADSLFVRMLFSGIQAYPDNGVSRPLDERSRGLTPADGAGIVVLKRYSDAVRDGNKIHAVVAGVGTSNDGRGKHLLSPNKKGQVLAFERAYAAAGLNAQDADYLECHATGTLLGDTTELSSIDEFFGQRQARPLMGASKANVGHLLTAAGMVSLLKVVLAMEKSVLPPTIHVDTPQLPEEGGLKVDQIVRSRTPWPQKDAPKRAAINAFGFGGTNAHLIVEHPSTEDPASATSTLEPPVALPSLAIVGMDAHFGGCNGLDAFDRSLYDGIQQFRPLPDRRWQGVEKTDLLSTYGLETIPEGAYIDQFQLDALRFKIPPNEVHKLHPQQLLMLQVADRALQDAGLTTGGNVAVIVAMETELSMHQLPQRWHLDWQVSTGLEAAAQGKCQLDQARVNDLTQLVKDSLHPPAQTGEYLGYIGNIMPSRISSLWDFNGPAFTLSAGEQSVTQALKVAQQLLARGEVEAVVVGAVDLAAGFEQVLLRHQSAPVNTEKPTWSFEQSAEGWAVGEGAGAVVLKRPDRASQDRIYALIDAIEMVETVPADSLSAEMAVMAACDRAQQSASVTPSDIGYLEICGSGVAATDKAEIRGLTQTYKQPNQPDKPELSCAVGSATATIGHTGIAAAMASLIKTSLCLYHRYLPVVPQWSAPKQLEQWEGTPFYAPQESRGWLGDMSVRRVAAINHLSAEGASAHLVLSEEMSQQARPSRYLEQRDLHLFTIAAQDLTDLQAKITAFKSELETEDLATLAQKTFETYQQNAHLPYMLALVGKTPKALKRDIDKAIAGVAKSFETGTDWQSPGGSYFTAHPQGKTGKVAFVYPGAFSAYIGIGQAQHRFRLFPDIHTDPMLQGLGDRLSNLDRLLYPRHLTALSRRQKEALDQTLLSDPLSMFESESGCAGLTTSILQNYFKIKPQMAFGYSLGETSMMLSQGVFANAEFDQESLHRGEAPLFGDRLSGPKNAVREYWGLPRVEPIDGSDSRAKNSSDLWSNYVLVAAVEAVKQAVEMHERVYVTQINTPNEVVIAGAPEACEAVVEALGCPGFRAPFDHVIHCETMASEKPALETLNNLNVQQRPPVDFYSAGNYQPMSFDEAATGSKTTHNIAQNIAQNLCKTLDFPRLVNKVYADGARIFVELGAGGTCCRWIDEILKDRPRMTTPLNLRGMDDHTSVVRALARLASHRVPLDLSPLYGEPPPPSSHQMLKTIQLGGDSITERILSDRNQASFQQSPVTTATIPAPEPVSSSSTPEPVPSFPAPEPVPSAVSASLFYENSTAISQVHTTFLNNRKAGLQQLSQIVGMHLSLTEQVTEDSVPENRALETSE